MYELPITILFPGLHMHLVFHCNTWSRVQPVAGVKAGICWRRWWCWWGNINCMSWWELRLWYSLLLLLLLCLHSCKLLWRNSRWKLHLLAPSRWGNTWSHTNLLLRRWNSWGHSYLLLLLWRGYTRSHTYLLLLLWWWDTWSKPLPLLWLLELLTRWRSKLLLLLLWRWRRLSNLLLLWRWLIELLLSWRRWKLLLLRWWWRLVHLLLLLRMWGRRLIHLLLLWRWRLIKLLLLWGWRLIELLLLLWRCWLPTLLLLQVDTSQTQQHQHCCKQHFKLQHLPLPINQIYCLDLLLVEISQCCITNQPQVVLVTASDVEAGESGFSGYSDQYTQYHHLTTCIVVTFTG